MTAPTASILVTLGLPAIALVAVTAFLEATRRAAPRRFGVVLAGTVLWIALWSGLALSGRLARFDGVPPPAMLMFLGVVACGLGIGLSPLGKAIATGVPLWLLVGFHAFRLPLELVMHRAAAEGVMPHEMSFSGYNFDIVTGATAIVVAWSLQRAGSGREGSGRGGSTRLAFMWNVLGSILLAVVMTIALVASPILRVFGEGAHVNSWVLFFPFQLLPTVLVALALAGHVIVFRRLAA